MNTIIHEQTETLKKNEKYHYCKKCEKKTVHRKSIKNVGPKQVPRRCFQCSECGKKS